MSGKESIPFTVKGPTSVLLDDTSGKSFPRSGCSIIDLQFQCPSQIGEVVFSNYYTAWLSIYVKRMGRAPLQEGKELETTSALKSTRTRPHFERSFSTEVKGCCSSFQVSHSSDEEIQGKDEIHSNNLMSQKRWRRRHSSGQTTPDFLMKPWELSIETKILMAYPNYEAGSQDVISIPATESAIEWRDVIVMRLVLHQPSVQWKKFYIEDLNVYCNLPKHTLLPGDDHVVKQRENWFSVLRRNTNEVISGQVAILGNPNSEDES